MFLVSCFVLAICLTTCIVLWIKNEHDFVAVMLIPTVLTLIPVILLAPFKGTVVDTMKILDSNKVIATEKDDKIEITPAFNYYILIEGNSGGRFIIQVDDFDGEVGDTYTYSLWQRFNQ